MNTIKRLTNTSIALLRLKSIAESFAMPLVARGRKYQDDLLPNEEFICDFGNIKSDTDRNKIIICNGECDREKRPYSCRIFPLFPYTTQTKNGVKIEIKIDPRAANVCPLNDIKMMDKNFIRAVRRSAKILATDKEYLRFLTETTSLLKEIEQLKSLLNL